MGFSLTASVSISVVSYILNSSGGVSGVSNSIEVPAISIQENLMEKFEQTVKIVEMEMESQAFTKNALVEKSMNDFLTQVSPISERKLRKVTSIVMKHIENFKRDNLKILEMQKDFFRKHVFPHIQEKVKRMNNISPTFMSNGDKSTLLSPEELELIRKEQAKLKEKIIAERQKLSWEAVDEMSQVIISTSGKRGIVNFSQRLNRYKFSQMEMQALHKVMDSGFVLHDDSLNKNYDVSNVLEGTAEKLHNKAKAIGKERQIIFSDPTYKACNHYRFGAIMHLGTLGFCSGYTVGANIDALTRGVPTDLNGMANVFKFILSLVSLNSASDVADLLYKASFAFDNRLYGLAGEEEVLGNLHLGVFGIFGL